MNCIIPFYWNPYPTLFNPFLASMSRNAEIKTIKHSTKFFHFDHKRHMVERLLHTFNVWGQPGPEIKRYGKFSSQNETAEQTAKTQKGRDIARHVFFNPLLSAKPIRCNADCVYSYLRSGFLLPSPARRAGCWVLMIKPVGGNMRRLSRDVEKGEKRRQ